MIAGRYQPQEVILISSTAASPTATATATPIPVLALVVVSLAMPPVRLLPIHCSTGALLDHAASGSQRAERWAFGEPCTVPSSLNHVSAFLGRAAALFFAMKDWRVLDQTRAALHQCRPREAVGLRPQPQRFVRTNGTEILAEVPKTKNQRARLMTKNKTHGPASENSGGFVFLSLRRVTKLRAAESLQLPLEPPRRIWACEARWRRFCAEEKVQLIVDLSGLQQCRVGKRMPPTRRQRQPARSGPPPSCSSVR